MNDYLLQILTLAWLALLSVPPGPAPVLRSVALPDMHGTLVHPLTVPGRLATVIVFIAHDCPISNAYAPEIIRLRADYGPSHIGLYVVYTDSASTIRDLIAHAKSHGFAGFALVDAAHTLVKMTGVTVTPEAVIFDPAAHVLYEGRIDDRFSDLGRERDIADTHDLRRALDAIRLGKAIVVARTPAVGCDISTP